MVSCLISAMVWVHTCVFPFYSELCGVRCGTHSTIRGVHTLFTPIDIQHTATEGRLGRGGRERKRKGESHANAFTFHTQPKCLPALTKAGTQIVVFRRCMALLCTDKNEKSPVSGQRLANKKKKRNEERKLSAPRLLVSDFLAGIYSVHMSPRGGKTHCWGHKLLPCYTCCHIFHHTKKEKTT